MTRFDTSVLLETTIPPSNMLIVEGTQTCQISKGASRTRTTTTPQNMRNSLKMRRVNRTYQVAFLLLVFCQIQAQAALTSSLRRDDDRLKSREARFPSVEERVKVYMTNWYVPPCESYSDGHIRYDYRQSSKETWPKAFTQGMQNHQNPNVSRSLLVENLIEPDTLFFLDRDILMDCANMTGSNDTISTISDTRKLEVKKRVKFRQNMRMYCHDVALSLLPALDHLLWEKEATTYDPMTSTPTFLQFGDNKRSHVFGGINIPHMKKFRSAVTDSAELTRITSQECYSTPRETLPTVHAHIYDSLQPIVWKLATHRHFEKLNLVYRSDTPWAKKKNMAIFRGQLTGSRMGYNKHLSDEQNCLNLMRCRLVYNHANSTLVYARLTSTRKRLPDVLNGVALVGGRVDVQALLAYKGIIMLEGNDVASGLKWALLSQSVVLMPVPKHTSWAMEELLEPWVHYIPLDDWATDIEEKMQWVLDNDADAQRIAERGTQWMEDLVFHPDAAEDDRLVEEEILRRYATHFMPL